MFKLKTITGILALLLVAACTGAPPPAPQSDTPPAAPSDTPIDEGNGSGYPVEVATQPAYPLPEIPTPDFGYPVPGDVTPADPESGYPAPEAEGCEFEAPAPQPHELTASDGVGLSGVYYPPAGCNAPLVVLYHQFGSDKGSWTDLALWLQNRGSETASAGGVLASPAGQYDWFPQLPADLSFAVFALDFRDHGESDPVDGSPDLAGFLLDAQAALDFARSLPNADPARVITIGASIGADASVDVCLALEGTAIAADQTDEGCIGALPLSPGSFLEVPYVETVTRLGEAPFNINILCLAAEQDGNAPELCRAEVPGRHAGIVFAGRSEHGIALLAEGFEPDIGQVIHDFLLETLGIEG